MREVGFEARAEGEGAEGEGGVGEEEEEVGGGCGVVDWRGVSGVFLWMGERGKIYHCWRRRVGMGRRVRVRF